MLTNNGYLIPKRIYEDPRFNLPTKCLIALLEDRADFTNTVFTCIAELERITGESRATVNRRLKLLTEHGVIKRKLRKGDRGYGLYIELLQVGSVERG